MAISQKMNVGWNVAVEGLELYLVIFCSILLHLVTGPTDETSEC
jgi:NADH:ubiquinone oxidoreductase subunit 4 (subunit M)